MNHEKVREAERTCSWREKLRESRLVLSRGWNADEWAVEVSCLDFLGEFDELRKSLERWIPSVEREDDVDIRSFSFYIIGRLHQSTGEYDIALGAYMRALALGPSPMMRALPLLQTSTINFFVESDPEARTNLEFVLHNAQARNDHVSAAHALDFLADLEFRQGRLDEAHVWMLQCRQEATLADNQYRLNWALMLEGQIEFARGNRAGGLDKMQRARQRFEECETRSSELHCCTRIGERLLKTGDLAEAKKVIERAVELSKRFKYNLTRARTLELAAELYERTGKLSREEAQAAIARAAFLKGRARKSWRLIHERGRVYSETEVAAFLKDLPWQLFEVVCQRVLELEGFKCERSPTGETFFDIFAERHIGTLQPFRWGVSCKRVQAGVTVTSDVPDALDLAALKCDAFMIMTIGQVSGPAARKLQTLRDRRIQVDIWDGPRLSSFLASHDFILVEVGTILTSPTPPAKSAAAGPATS